MKLLVNVCGHNLCESCVELLFAKGSGACPECATPLRRNNFRLQLFEDALIDKEVDIRKRVLKDFNKKEEDFEGDLDAYNNYLEAVEDIVFNLSNGIDLTETNRKIAEYKERNRDLIARNRHRQSREQIELEDILAAERNAEKLRRIDLAHEAEAEKVAKTEGKEKLIDDLMFSEGDAKSIIEQHQRTKTLQPPTFSAQVGAQNHHQRQDDNFVETTPFQYEPLRLFTEGPAMPKAPHEYLSYVRPVEATDKASGFHERLPCTRALQEAMCGLFYSNCRDN